MRGILQKIRANPINYDVELKNADINIPYDKDTLYDISVVIPVRGRQVFLKSLLDSFLNTTRSSLKIQITVVEHDKYALHWETCFCYKVNYVRIKDDRVFNKCLAFNLGAIVNNNTKWYVCHDLDCLVQPSFFEGLMKNIENKKAVAIQSFNRRRVIYCNQYLTDVIIGGAVDVASLTPQSDGTFVVNGEAPGGSITLTKDLFFNVGGYDPELFWGYSPEDRFFGDKISMFTTVFMCDDPIVEVYHLNHPSSVNTNPQLKEMVALEKKFASLPHEWKDEIVKYKAKLISKYYD